MEKRLSLADLKAKSVSVLPNSELFTGGESEYCHFGLFKDWGKQDNIKKA